MPQALKLVTSPAESEVQELRSWLEAEYERNGEGFFSNWSLIEKAYGSSTLMLGRAGSDIIGFVAWQDREDYLECLIFDIKEECQRRGYGNALYSLFESEFTSTHLAVTLECMPTASTVFWEKQGFVKVHDIGCASTKSYYYKPIISTLKPSSDPQASGMTNKIMLWDCESCSAGGKDPAWVWSLPDFDTLAQVPILWPCNANWQLEIVQGGQSIKKQKVKYVSEQVDRYRRDDFFLYIYENPIGQ